MRRRPLVAAVAASALALVGCASGASNGSPGDGTLRVVASTIVYGQIVEEVGGDAVTVTSLISSGRQDPHAYEASARDQLAVGRADLIVDNGGGYDPFVDALIVSSGAAAPVLTAVDFAPVKPGHPAPDATPDDEHAHTEGLNEHVWYDPASMAALAGAIADELGTLDPAGAATFHDNAARFSAQIDGLEADLAAIAAAHGGAEIFVTEPVPLYLTGAAGLVEVTPSAFSQAVEEGQDVPPATLLDSLDLLASGDVRIVIVNAQTGGAETTRVVDAARERGIPVLEFTETLPDGSSYVQWMQGNIDDLAAALTT